jgi:hypothetical protein
MGNHRRIPEHVRLGVKPEDAGVSLLHDESGMSRVPRRQQRIPPPPEPVGSAPVRVAAKPPGEPHSYAVPPFKRGMNAPAAQADVRVQVGNHEDSLWMDGVAGRPREPRQPQVIDNNDTIDLRAAEGTAHMDATMGFEQPAASAPVQQQPELVRYQRADPEMQPKQFAIPEGAYGIIHQGQVVFVSRDIDQVRQIIEDWVLEHQVPIGSLTVLKNVPIGFGVILEQK